jgi:hypothetical protein
MKLKFSDDKFYGGECIFVAGKVYEVDEKGGWAARWIKRGGIEVAECPIVVAAPIKNYETSALDTVHNSEDVVTEGNIDAETETPKNSNEVSGVGTSIEKEAVATKPAAARRTTANKRKPESPLEGIL